MRIRMPSIAILTTFLVLTALPVGAADYYVAPGGNDGNSGTSGSPWRTLQYAADSVGPGDVVHVADGTYVGFQVRTSGTASSPITFQAQGLSALVNTDNPSTPDIINIEGADYIVIDGFVVEDATRVGVRAVQATGVVVRNNVIARSGLTAILTGWTPQIQIIGNVCGTSLGEHGIYVSNSNVPNDNPIIRDNECYGNAKNGIQINGDCWEGGDGIISGAILEGNFVHDNNWKGLSLISMQNSIVRNNVIYDNGVGAGAGGIHFADQVGPSCGKPSSNNTVVNNTVVEPRIACIRMTDGSTGNIVFNNICVASDNARLIEDEVGGNLIDAGSNITTLSSAGLFADEGNKDYHPASSSAAIDAGVSLYQSINAPGIDRDGGSRPAGAAWDVGAYEYGAGGADTTPPAASIAAPGDQSTVAGNISVSATATDNIGVAGVQFFIDGRMLGLEDLLAPYAANLSTLGETNGAHTLHCEVRDLSGNRATSPPITVFVDNQVQAGTIPTTHPRLWFNTGWLAALRDNACLDEAGNTVPGCTPTNFWGIFKKFIDTTTKAEAWHYALAWQVTGDIGYANTAISMANNDVACGMQCIGNANNKFLYVRDYMRDVALVYDWCYDVLSAQERADYINYMNIAMFVTFNDQPDANAIYDTGDWATNNPKQNYFYNYMLAATYVALATYYENPGSFTYGGQSYSLYLLLNARDSSSDRYSDVYEFLMAKMNEQMFPILDTIGKGGGWLEGENYGRAMKRHIAEAFCLLDETAGVDYFNDPAHPFMKEAVRYQFYTVQPGGGILYPGGDGSQDPVLHTNPYDRHLMLLAARGLAGTTEGQYAQYYCNNEQTIMSGISQMIPVDFFLEDPRLPERDYRELPMRYLSEGMDWVNSRSDWTDNAVSVTFTSTDRIQGHQHREQNHFVIYVGGSAKSVDGWILTDPQPFSSTLPRATDWHNTILVDGVSQRFGRGTGAMVKYETSPTYTYAVGDASDAYYTNPGNYGAGDEKMVDVFQRELVHVLPGYVVAFDRISLSANHTSDLVEVLFHYPYVKPSVSGNLITATNDGARVFHRILTPDNAVVKWVDDDVVAGSDRMDTWRAEITDPVTKPNYQFLNVFHATSSSVGTTPAADKVTTNNGQMTGAVIRDAAQEQVILFSTDLRGAPPATDVIYEVGVLINSRHHLFDLVPGLGYSIAVSGSDTRRVIHISEGGDHVASAAGSLVFTLEEIVSKTLPVATR